MEKENQNKVEFTKEGLDKVCEKLDFLPEDQRKKIVIETIKSVIRA